MDEVSKQDRVRLLGAFAQAVREREFSTKGKDDLVSSTCKEAVDKVAENFRANNRCDPRYGEHGQDTHEILKKQYRGYANTDPPVKQQKALTPAFYRHLYNTATTKKQTALALLAISAFFFACRSCEYSKTQGERKTKLARLRNIRFFIGHREINHRDPDLVNADTVSWTFEDQKNDERNVTIPQDNNNDPLLNPVRALAITIQRILSYKNTNNDTTLCTYRSKGKLLEFKSEDILQAFRTNARVMGKDTLGFSPEDIGTHSNRSAAAMAMFLDDTPVFMIMLVGRWSSDAFLKYIRRQVLEFSKGISKGMIKCDTFFTIPHFQRDINDPRTQNKHSFATNLSMAPSANKVNHRPAFSLWN